MNRNAPHWFIPLVMLTILSLCEGVWLTLKIQTISDHQKAQDSIIQSHSDYILHDTASGILTPTDSSNITDSCQITYDSTGHLTSIRNCHDTTIYGLKERLHVDTGYFEYPGSKPKPITQPVGHSGFRPWAVGGKKYYLDTSAHGKPFITGGTITTNTWAVGIKAFNTEVHPHRYPDFEPQCECFPVVNYDDTPFTHFDAFIRYQAWGRNIGPYWGGEIIARVLSRIPEDSMIAWIGKPTWDSLQYIEQH